MGIRWHLCQIEIDKQKYWYRQTMNQANVLVNLLCKNVWAVVKHFSSSEYGLISNYIHYKMWDEITYPFLNFNGATVEV